MFVNEQNGNLIFDLRYYSIYRNNKKLFIYDAKLSLPEEDYLIAEFQTVETCKNIANEIIQLIKKFKKTGKSFYYKIPKQ